MSKIYRFTFGDFECTVFEDSASEMPASGIFASVAEEERESAIANSPYNPEAIALAMNVLLLERDGKRILIETGNIANDPENAVLFSLLDEAGIEPESIDLVTISHAHADHYSGMLDAEGQKCFPNADYVIWQAEWMHYSSDEQMARELARGQERHDFIKQYFVGLTPYLRFVNEDNDELIAGIRAIPAAGHTRHHVRYEIKSQGQMMHVLGDAFLHPLTLDNPHWTFSFEYDDEAAIATRKQLRDTLGDDLVLVYHFPFPGVGHVIRENGNYVWQAL